MEDRLDVELGVGELGSTESATAGAGSSGSYTTRAAASTRPVARGDARSYRMRRLMAGADAAAILLAAGITYFASALVGRPVAPSVAVLPVIALIPVWLLIGSQMGLYHRSEQQLDASVANEASLLIVMATAWSWIYVLMCAAITSGPTSVMTAVLLWLTLIAALLAIRPIARQFAHTRSWFAESVAVIGGSDDVQRVVARLSRHPEYGLRLDGTWSLPERAGSPDESGRFVSEVDQLRAELVDGGVARVIIATEPQSVRDRGELIRSLLEDGVQVDIVSGEIDAFTSSAMLNYMEGLPVVTIPVIRQSRVSKVIKRWIDVAASFSALVILSPLLAYCAIRIKLGSPGPILFKQTRIGRHREPFEVYKFRSMAADAEERKSELAEENMHATSQDPDMFKIPSDPRITRFGAVLRRWSADELPQLLNVLKGQMSLVGPRPLIPEESCRISGHYAQRFRVRPGLTGVWQAHGRSDIGFEDMIKLDYAYAENWTVAEDLKLILRTAEVITQGRGAY